ncbi:MAG: Flp family type IVb pilin [Acidobacteriaceae bacterium]
MKQLLRSFLRDQSGHDKVEFALIAGFLALLLIGGEKKLGNKIDKDYKAIGTTISKLK